MTLSGLTVTMPIEHWEELKKTHLPKEETRRRRDAIMKALEDFAMSSGIRASFRGGVIDTSINLALNRFLKVLEENLP